MRTSSLAATTDIYECGTASVVVPTRISHERFGAYSQAVRRLIHGLGEAASDEIWKPILTPLRRCGFALCAAPLPFNEPSVQPPDAGKLNARQQSQAMSYTAQAIQLGNTILCLEALRQSNENP
jgi:hypothetical protein